ncbi:hypothetical protein FACS18945_5340 [Bacteroidia bacterium]|nr:hypothetical protein FACS18945_5340 [Bacteroidia bacterium]
MEEEKQFNFTLILILKTKNTMKKIFLSIGLLFTLGIATAVFNSCGDDKDEPKKEEPTDPINPNDPTYPSTTDSGVVINGIKWATRNVDKPGTFAANPGSEGMFYQWNRKTAWAATGSVTNWDSATPAGTEWTAANDPSPAGWRVPTYAEGQTLLNTEKVTSEWTTQNGVNGYKFTDKTTNNSLFLPAAGYRNSSDGTLGDAGSYGNYWSSTQDRRYYAYGLGFYSGYAGWGDGFRSYGFSVRAVAE